MYSVWCPPLCWTNQESRFDYRHEKHLFCYLNVHCDTGAHPAYQSQSPGGFSHKGEATGAWSWPLISTIAEVKNEWSCISSPFLRHHGRETSLHVRHDILQHKRGPQDRDRGIYFVLAWSASNVNSSQQAAFLQIVPAERTYWTNTHA